LAAGFGSVRRFNHTFQQLFRRPPKALRAKRVTAAAEADVTVRLRYHPPYDWDAMLSFLAARAVSGVEEVLNGVYRRTLGREGATGTVAIAHDAKAQSLVVTIRLPDVAVLASIVQRVRRVFDLGADVAMIGAHLSQDPVLARLVDARPGLRVPGAWDGFEVGVRAVLGQQVTLAAGRRLTEHLVKLCGGQDGEAAQGRGAALSRTFPSPSQLLAADLAKLGMPDARRETLRALARAALADARLFEPAATVEETVAKLRAVKGIGEWTAHYIALRAANEPDAFPASDVALLRQISRGHDDRLEADEFLARAEAWRPFRAYAAQHLWTADAERSHK